MKKIGAHVSVSGGVEMAPVNALGIGAVSYTHLTLPTKRIVEFSLVPVFLKKKKNKRKKKEGADK